MYSLDINDLFKAYYDARRNKRNTISQLAFELNLESNLISLYEDLISGNYQISPHICFTIEDPVKREVLASEFRDRVVHHLIYNYLSPIFENRFIYDSYSCRKGKGTLFGVKRLEHHIRSCSENYTKDCYILKLDIEGYFMNINREILLSQVAKVLSNGEYVFDKKLILDLCKNLILNEPIINCRIKGVLSDWDKLPKTKSLFASKNGCGLPIGNLTSQLFSNIYLDALDQWIKRSCRVKHYGRYVDDFYLIHNDRDFLLSLIPRINDFLKNNLDLTLHPKKVYFQHYTKGVSFLGYVVKPYYKVIGNRTKKKIFELYDFMESTAIEKRADVLLMGSQINSYLGILHHVNSYNLRSKVFSYVAPYLYGYYEGSNGKYKFKC